MRARYLAALVFAVVALAGCGGSGQSRVVIAAGTTLVDSGFMAELVASYAQISPDTTLSVVGLSSAEAIAYAQAHTADLIVTHTADALDAFLENHPVALRVRPFTSTFFLVADPSLTFEPASLEATLAVVAEEGLLFVSRDDGSGTNAAELDAWAAIGFDPREEPWYIRTGTGMGATLLVTDQRHGVTLAEHGAYLASSETLSLVVLAGTNIDNPYDLTVVDASGNPEARLFSDWLMSDSGRQAITDANQRLFGQQVYIVP